MSVIFNFIQQVFAVPFGFILSLFYGLTNNYIVAIIFLTILVKLCFLPNAIKQHKNGLKLKKLNLKINKLKEIHADNPEKLKQELQAVQASANLKKRNLGCLSFIVHFVVLIGLFNVIYTPLTNVLHVNDATLHEITTVMSENNEDLQGEKSTNEITILKEIADYKEELIERNVVSEEQYTEIITFRDEYNFMGLNLSHSPEIKRFNTLWLVPLLVFVVGIGSSLYSLIFRKMHTPGARKFTALEALPFISPMLLFLFAFMFPAGVGLYWAISNLLSLAQTIVLNNVYNPYKVVLTSEEERELVESSETGEIVSETVEPNNNELAEE